MSKVVEDFKKIINQLDLVDIVLSITEKRMFTAIVDFSIYSWNFIIFWFWSSVIGFINISDEYLYANKFKSLNEIEKFLERHKLPKLI